MKNLRNDFTDQMLILAAITIPSLIGAGIGGGAGFIVALVIGAPLGVLVVRYMNGGFSRSRPTRPRRSRNSS